MTIQPTAICVNPAFDLRDAPGTLLSVTLGGRSLKQGEYAWDGHTLWLNARIDHQEELQLAFGASRQR